MSKPGGGLQANFDEFSKIRILDPSHFEGSEKLKEECKDFGSKINDFTGIIGQFVDILSTKASQIEREKLLAIGQRIKVETEVENRKSSKLQLQTMIRERQAELDRLVLQADSLSKVHVDQKALIESLSNK